MLQAAEVRLLRAGSMSADHGKPRTVCPGLFSGRPLQDWTVISTEAWSIGRPAFRLPVRDPRALYYRVLPAATFVAARNSATYNRVSSGVRDLFPVGGSISSRKWVQIRFSNYAPCRAFAPCVLLSKPRDAGLAGVRRPRLWSYPPQLPLPLRHHYSSSTFAIASL